MTWDTSVARDKIALHLGRTIYAHRVIARISGEDLAERVGITRQSVDRIEKGDLLPSLATLYLIGEVFDCEAGDLLPTREQVHS